MGKYEPLQRHLEGSGRSQVPMSFAEIERVLGFPLPPSSRKYRGWWSNNAANSVITRTWLDAGFRTEQVDMAEGRLVFRRAGERPGGSGERPVRTGHHPLIGCMEGTITFAPDYDPGEPADPAWGEIAWNG
jgi:hypothetical protein